MPFQLLPSCGCLQHLVFFTCSCNSLCQGTKENNFSDILAPEVARIWTESIMCIHPFLLHYSPFIALKPGIISCPFRYTPFCATPNYFSKAEVHFRDIFISQWLWERKIKSPSARTHFCFHKHCILKHQGFSVFSEETLMTRIKLHEVPEPLIIQHCTQAVLCTCHLFHCLLAKDNKYILEY